MSRPQVPHLSWLFSTEPTLLLSQALLTTVICVNTYLHWPAILTYFQLLAWHDSSDEQEMKVKHLVALMLWTLLTSLLGYSRATVSCCMSWHGSSSPHLPAVLSFVCVDVLPPADWEAVWVATAASSHSCLFLAWVLAAFCAGVSFSSSSSLLLSTGRGSFCLDALVAAIVCSLWRSGKYLINEG